MRFLALPLVVSLLSSLAFAKELSLPETLTCEALTCIEGVPSHCLGEQYGFPLTLKGLQSGHPTLRYNPLKYTNDSREEFPGTIRLKGLISRSRVVMDFSPYDFADSGIRDRFTFAREDLAALAAGSKTRIPGVFVEGPYWYDTYKDVARLQLECWTTK